MSPCPKCGKEVFEEAVFCPYCGTPIKRALARRSVYPSVGGVLEIIAISICLFVGIWDMVALWVVGFSIEARNALGFMSVSSFAGFGLGLIGAVFTLSRQYFRTSILGAIAVVTSGLINILVFSTMWKSEYYSGLIFGMPIILLAILSLTFTAISKKEFT